MEFAVGDKVKVIARSPSCGLGNIKRGDTGTVASFDGEFVLVNFAKQRGWCGLPCEFELVKPSKTGPNREIKRPEREW